MKTLTLVSILIFLLLPMLSQDYPPILSLEERTEEYNKNLEWKLNNVLPEIMRREGLDKKHRDRLVSAKNVVVGWYETRTPWEVGFYKNCSKIGQDLIKEFYSIRAIIPDVTTSREVRWWICERIKEMKLDYWFFPSLDIIRSPKNREMYGKDDVIHHGDLLHCDVGISYMGLSTDMQHLAYVCKLDEDDAPLGLKDLYAKGLRFQEIVLEEMVGGRTGNEILKRVLERGKAENLKPWMYSHPVNYYGHGSAMVIGITENQEFLPGTGEHPLYPNTTYAMEFNVSGEIPEWENELIRMGFEDNVIYNGKKAELIDGYPQKLYLIK